MLSCVARKARSLCTCVHSQRSTMGPSLRGDFVDVIGEALGMDRRFCSSSTYIDTTVFL